IIDTQNEYSNSLENKLKNYCPFLQLNGVLDKKEEYTALLKNKEIQLLFINPEVVSSSIFDEANLGGESKALICVSNSSDFIIKKDYWNSVAYLLNPIQENRLINAVEAARQKIRKHQNSKFLQQALHNGLEKATKGEDQLIGIPTIKGFEIVPMKNIIRCEGLQKCTRIIIEDGQSIVSSYNIGIYKKLMTSSRKFISVHRSHLINLQYVSKFRKVGEIVMKDESVVPIALNKREDFLSRITKI
ncbi:MAG: LytTR family transcriptional regulator DNA-binding domain-containing protein, partial [Bacteroidota bacterium]